MSDEIPAPPTGNDDDELAALPRARRPKSPLVALAVIVLSGLIVWHLRFDLAYALAGGQPRELGDARNLAAGGAALADNSFVSVAGQAERRYALWVEPRGERERQTIFRLFGAGTRLFVRAADTTGRSDDLGERWTGRLRRFDAVPWAPSLRDYYAKRTEVVRYLGLDGLAGALAGSDGAALRDRTGAPIEVRPETPLVVDVAYPGELKVYLSKDKYPSLADARHELERLKLAPGSGEDLDSEYLFLVPLPAARKNEIVDLLSEKELVFQPRNERYATTRAALRLDGDTLVVGKLGRVPWAQVTAVGVPTPVVIGSDAFILIEGERPSQFWWAPVLAVLLLAFAAFNVWYLVRSVRARTAA